MAAVAVGGFHDQIIGVGRHGGILDKGLVQVADIARKHQRLGAAARLGNAQRDGRAAQKVPHVGEQHLNFSRVTVKKRQPFVIGAGHKLAHDLLRVLHGVVRLDRRRTAALRLAVFPLDLLLLDMRRVLQHDVAQVGGGIGSVDGGTEPVFVQVGNAPRMVDVRMGQQQRLVAPGGKGQRGVLIDVAPLFHAAVHQKAVAGGLHLCAAAGNLPRCAQKRQFHRSTSQNYRRPTPLLGASGRVKGSWKLLVKSLIFIRTAQNTSP